MWLTDVSIKRPLFILMVILGLLMMGGIAYTRLGADLYPRLNIPAVTVVVLYPGAGPEVVESKVTKPVENAVAGVNNVKRINSFSMENVALIAIEFKDGTDSNLAAVDVDRKVNAIRSALPAEAKAPSVIRAEMNAMPVMNLVFSGRRSADQLYAIADEQIRPRLEAVSGVANVQVAGGRDRKIAVRVDQSRLQAYGLSMQQVTAALAQTNLSLPAGRLQQGDQEFTVRYDSLYRSVDELRDLIVYAGANGIVHLKDVATVEDGFKTQTLIGRYDGQEAVAVIITKQSDANTVRVATEVRKTIADLQRTMLGDLTIAVAGDQATFVRRSLDDIQTRLGEAVLLTGLVLLLFLHTFRSTAIVLCSIPTSLVTTFLVMWMMGFSLNMMSMMALTLTVGILVDDSIVVLENIFRHMRLGKSPFAAALAGRNEIGLAAIAITLVDVVVYTPVAFMSGMVGQFFREFGLTIATATLISLFISFTLTPMLASRLLALAAPEQRKSLLGRFGDFWEAAYDRLALAYRGVLGWALRHRWTVLGIGAIVFFASLAPLPMNLISFEFMPAEDQGEFKVNIEMPAGTALAATNRVSLEMENRISKMPEVRDYLTIVGNGNAGFGTVSEARYATIDVKLAPKAERSKSAATLAREAEALGKDLPGAKVRTTMPSTVGGGGQPFLVQVRGDEAAKLRQVAAQVAEIVRAIPGTSNITNSAALGSPEILVQADPRRLADLGLTSAQVAATLRADVEGSVVTALESDGNKKVDIRVVGENVARQNAAEIGSLPLQTARGSMVRLDQVGEVAVGAGPTQIERNDRQRSVVIGADLTNRPLGDVVRDFRAAVAEAGLPAGYSVKTIGEAEAMDESFTNLFLALILSVFLMYMLMVALYESLLHPLVIMFALPVSLAGAFAGLLITGKTLNMTSMIGLIMLMGLVGKNGILLVDYTNTLRKAGKSRLEALLEAGPTRLRPILMTTAAMVLAMMPVALSTGEGAEMSSPTAVVVIGGLLSSTLLTLVLVPAVYTIFDDLQMKLFGRRAKLAADGAPRVSAVAPAAVTSNGHHSVAATAGVEEVVLG